MLWSIGVACAPRAQPATSALGDREPKLTSCDNLTIVHAKLYASPDTPPLADARIELSGSRVVEISSGSRGGDSATCVLDAQGRAVTSGYWNSHVHLTDRALYDENQAGAFIEDMLLSRGFTSVLDTGAELALLRRLQSAINGGSLKGPRIAVASGGFVFEEGTPSYLPKGMLPELSSPEQATPLVEQLLDTGVEGIKIFSGSFQTPTHTIHLPPDIIQRVTELAHKRGRFVVSHPTDLVGLSNAVDNGVDILAHTAPPAGRLDAALLARMKQANVALIPTLKLWHWELERHGVPKAVVQHYIESGVQQLDDYHAIGGEVLFGTDVGYVRDFDTTEEFELMARAGLDFRSILASLTTLPGRRFAPSEEARVQAGLVRVGADADLVVLKEDPADDVRAFATPLFTIRGGRVVYQAN